MNALALLLRIVNPTSKMMSATATATVRCEEGFGLAKGTRNDEVRDFSRGVESRGRGKGRERERR